MANAVQKTRPVVGEVEVLIDSGSLPQKYKVPSLIAGGTLLAISVNILVNMLWGFWIVPVLMRELGDIKPIVFLVTTGLGAMFINICFARRWVLLNPKTKQIVIENQWIGGIRSSAIYITQIKGLAIRHTQRGSREFWDLSVENVNDTTKWLTRITTSNQDAKDLAGKIALKINRKVAWR